MSVSIKSQNRSRNRVTKTITAEVRLPDRVTAAQGCAGGSITLVTKRGGRVIDDSQLRLNRDCEVTKRITVSRSGSQERSRPSARFGGNRVLLPASSQTRRFSR